MERSATWDGGAELKVGMRIIKIQKGELSKKRLAVLVGLLLLR